MKKAVKVVQRGHNWRLTRMALTKFLNGRFRLGLYRELILGAVGVIQNGAGVARQLKIHSTLRKPGKLFSLICIVTDTAPIDIPVRSSLLNMKQGKPRARLERRSHSAMRRPQSPVT
jgi:hypothetical protein